MVIGRAGGPRAYDAAAPLRKRNLRTAAEKHLEPGIQRGPGPGLDAEPNGGRAGGVVRELRRPGREGERHLALATQPVRAALLADEAEVLDLVEVTLQALDLVTHRGIRGPELRGPIRRGRGLAHLAHEAEGQQARDED